MYMKLLESGAQGLNIYRLQSQVHDQNNSQKGYEVEVDDVDELPGHIVRKMVHKSS
jgi:hypothetical protein